MLAILILRPAYSIRWKNLLVFEVLFQVDDGSYDSCELCKVHDIAAGVRSEVLFNHLFQNPADAGSKAGKSGRINNRFHELVVRHGEYVSEIFIFKSKIVV